jgi:hypothetical protein
METEYLDIVNKELRDIQQFFAQYYYPTPITQQHPYPVQHAPTVLPLLKPILTSPPTSPPSSSTHNTDDHGDDLFDFPSLYHTSSPLSSFGSVGDAAERDQYVTDLRDRYKQLKAIQDQMHLELTRSRILKQSIQVVGVTNRLNDNATSSPLPSQEKRGAHFESANRTMTEPVAHSPLSFADTPDRGTVSTPTPPVETGGTIITTTTTGTGTGTTIITTTTSTAVGAAMNEGEDPTAQQQVCRRNPFTFTGIRRRTGMIYQDTKTLMSSFSLMRYALMGLVLGVLLVGWLDCTDNNNNGNNHNNHGNVFGHQQLPVTSHKVHHTFFSSPEHTPPPKDGPRYPWPRH